MNPHNFFGAQQTQQNTHAFVAMVNEPLIYRTEHTMTHHNAEHWLGHLRNVVKCVHLDELAIANGLGAFFNHISVPWGAYDLPPTNASVHYTNIDRRMYLVISVTYGDFLIPADIVQAIIDTQQHQMRGQFYKPQQTPKPQTEQCVYQLPQSVVSTLRTLLDLGVTSVHPRLNNDAYANAELHRFFRLLGFALVPDRLMFPSRHILVQVANHTHDLTQLNYALYDVTTRACGAVITASDIAGVLDNDILASVYIVQLRTDHDKARLSSTTAPNDVLDYQLPVVVANTMRAMLMVDTDTAYHRLSNPRVTPEVSRFFQILGFSLHDDYATLHSHHFGECADPHHGFFGTCIALRDHCGLRYGDIITDSDIHDVLQNHFIASIRASELRREHAKTHAASTITLRDAPAECWGVYHPCKQYAQQYAKTLQRKNPLLRIDYVDDGHHGDFLLKGTVLVLATRTLPASLRERLQDYTILNLETGLRMVI